MQEIWDQYGDLIIGVVSAGAMMAITLILFKETGVMGKFIDMYLNAAC